MVFVTGSSPTQLFKDSVPQLKRKASSRPLLRTVALNKVLVRVRGVECDLRDVRCIREPPIGELQSRSRIPNGNYWYDRVSGAWGIEGGPCSSFILAGMSLGGQLRSDASRGDTGLFINGRQLHRRDVAVLRQLGPVFPGRYWVDAHGNFGFEGGLMLGNLRVAAIQLAQRSTGNGGGNDTGSWSHRSSYTGSSVGGDGQAFYCIDKNPSYSSEAQRTPPSELRKPA